MQDYKEVVTGRIVDRDGAAVAGAKVRVYDKDLLFNDHLGTAVSGQDGRFRVDFTWSQYKDSYYFDGRPDIFVKVSNPETGKTTKSEVFENLTGELSADDSVEVMDLGDLAVD